MENRAGWCILDLAAMGPVVVGARGSSVEIRWRETLVFELAGRRYGLPAADVQELVRIVTITPMPPGSGPIEGVINLRGTIVPVFDLRARLGLPAGAIDVRESLVILRRDGRAVAIRVDRPLDLVSLDVGDFEPGPTPGSGIGQGSPGVAKLADGLAVLLDPAPMLEVAAMAWPAGAAGGGA